MLKKHADALLFIAECVIGAIIGYSVYSVYPVFGLWCLLSIILVLSPDREDSVKLAIVRIKANIVGAAIGLSLLIFHPANMLLVCVGIAAAIAVCELLKLQEAARSAVIAVLIIAMHEQGKYFWNVAVERAAGVMLGCFIGVIITYVFHNLRLRYRANRIRKGSSGE